MVSLSVQSGLKLRVRGAKFDWPIVLSYPPVDFLNLVSAPSLI